MLPSLAENISQSDANARMLVDCEFESLSAMLADGINAASKKDFGTVPLAALG